MDSSLLAVIALVVFVFLLMLGRGQVAKGANAQVANGAVLLTIATLVGLLALGLVASLDVW